MLLYNLPSLFLGSSLLFYSFTQSFTSSNPNLQHENVTIEPQKSKGMEKSLNENGFECNMECMGSKEWSREVE
jgi:hypothetical protein